MARGKRKVLADTDRNAKVEPELLAPEKAKEAMRIIDDLEKKGAAGS
jgi:hypothetical protein